MFIHHRNNKFTVKRNLFRLPILSIGYTTSFTKDSKTKTTCIIDWYDPIYNIVRTTRASVVKHPDDKPSELLAKRLSESRCKMVIYDKYHEEVSNILKTIKDKYHELIYTEINNQTNLINNL